MQAVNQPVRMMRMAMILCAFMVCSAAAQPSLTLQREFGSFEVCEMQNWNYVEYANSVATTNDAGAVMIGPMYQACGPLNVSPTVVKVDRFGNMLWNRTYNIESAGDGYEIYECNNGELVWTCTMNDFASGIVGALVVRTNAGGGVLWARLVYCDDQPARVYHPHSIIESTSNGDIVVCGYVDDQTDPFNRRDIFLSRLSATGTLLWANYYDWTQGSEETANFLREDSNGDLILAGWAMHRLTNDINAFLMKTTSAGAITWTHHYGNSLYPQTFESLAIDAQNDIYAAGFWDQSGTTADVYVVRASGGTGNQLGLSYRYDVIPGSHDGAYSINHALNGTGFVLCGESVTAPYGLNQYNSFSMEVAAGLGAPVWVRRYGASSKYDILRSIELTPGTGGNPAPGYWMAGGVDPLASLTPTSDREFFLIRSNQIGQTICTQQTDPDFETDDTHADVKYRLTTCDESIEITMTDKSIMVQTTTCTDIVMKTSVDVDQSPDPSELPRIFPNPIGAGQMLALDTSDLELQSIEVRDLLGRLLFSRENLSKGEVVRLNTQGYSAGTYLVTFIQLDGSRSSATLQITD